MLAADHMPGHAKLRVQTPEIAGRNNNQSGINGRSVSELNSLNIVAQTNASSGAPVNGQRAGEMLSQLIDEIVIEKSVLTQGNGTKFPPFRGHVNTTDAFAHWQDEPQQIMFFQELPLIRLQLLGLETIRVFPFV